MKLHYLFLFSILIFAAACSSKPDAQLETKPNIIHIFADDLGYGDLGCFGAKDIKTPNIDKIASEGIKFNEFYSASHICSPSRAGLMTGRHPVRMGIHGVFFPESYTGMPQSEITIAEVLKDQGYQTGVVGKWHLGHREEYLPLQQGFDSYYGIPYSNDMESVVYMDGNQIDSFAVDQHYITRTYTQKALDFIETNKSEPFFLYLAHNMPHVPLYTSNTFEGTSDRGLYGDVIQELDWSVGQILEKLEKENLLDNTLLVFSSDNGPWLVMEDHGGSNGGLREGKQFTFEGGMRVPTVAMWKGKIPAGKVYENLASQMDWFPTFTTLSGGNLPQDRPIDGKDLTEVLLGNGERLPQEYLYFDGGNPQAYRSGHYKIKEKFKGVNRADWRMDVPPHDTLLINLKEDFGSEENLYHKQRVLGQNLFKKRDSMYASMGDLPAPLIIRSSSDRSHYEYLKKKHSK